MKKTDVISRFEKLPVPVKLATAGTAACFADFISFPLDTAKVRLQIQGEVRAPVSVGGVIPPTTATASAAAAQYRGIIGTIATISREEGFRSLYNGLNAGLQRQICFASIRLGFYEPVKGFYQGVLKVDASNKGGLLDIGARIMAGLTTGGMAVLCAQPTDVVKVRFQAMAKKAVKPAASAQAAVASGARYTGTWMAYKTIFLTEGVPGLWKGWIPNVGRNAICNVAEVVCYDIVKEAILTRGYMNDNVPLHFTSAVIAGFCATVCASPIDVIKTRYMNSPPGTYKGAFECAVQTFLREGATAFYKGFVPSFSRLVSWNIVMWLSYEQLKRVVVENYDKENSY